MLSRFSSRRHRPVRQRDSNGSGYECRAADIATQTERPVSPFCSEQIPSLSDRVRLLPMSAV